MIGWLAVSIQKAERSVWAGRAIGIAQGLALSRLKAQVTAHHQTVGHGIACHQYIHRIARFALANCVRLTRSASTEERALVHVESVGLAAEISEEHVRRVPVNVRGFVGWTGLGRRWLAKLLFKAQGAVGLIPFDTAG